jgi:hypothetical protein
MALGAFVMGIHLVEEPDFYEMEDERRKRRKLE